MVLIVGTLEEKRHEVSQRLCAEPMRGSLDAEMEVFKELDLHTEVRDSVSVDTPAEDSVGFNTPAQDSVGLNTPAEDSMDLNTPAEETSEYQEVSECADESAYSDRDSASYAVAVGPGFQSTSPTYASSMPYLPYSNSYATHAAGLRQDHRFHFQREDIQFHYETEVPWKDHHQFHFQREEGRGPGLWRQAKKEIRENYGSWDKDRPSARRSHPDTQPAAEPFEADPGRFCVGSLSSIVKTLSKEDPETIIKIRGLDLPRGKKTTLQVLSTYFSEFGAVMRVMQCDMPIKNSEGRRPGSIAFVQMLEKEVALQILARGDHQQHLAHHRVRMMPFVPEDKMICRSASLSLMAQAAAKTLLQPDPDLALEQAKQTFPAERWM